MTLPRLTLQTTQKTLTSPHQDITLEKSTNKTNVIESRDLLSMKKKITIYVLSRLTEQCPV